MTTSDPATSDPTTSDPATRTERDSLGTIQVPADRYWGAQTQRSLEHFDIGRDRFVWGRPVIRALGLVKSAAARANAQLGALDVPPEVLDAIVRAADEVAEGRWDDHFPLVVFQTGSGTHTNMNANEVIAHRAEEILAEENSAEEDSAQGRASSGDGSPDPGGRSEPGGQPAPNEGPEPARIHPNDVVNRGQSSNDVFPTVVHIAAALELTERLFPAVAALEETLRRGAAEYRDLVMIGRTHLQDATPITLGQVYGGWAQQVSLATDELCHAADGLLFLALGGTAVGTGVNTHPRFGAVAIELLAEATGLALAPAQDYPAALSGREAPLAVSAGLRGLAAALMKVANDVRWLGAGPRAGIAELVLPAGEPGSSIMPGKINPTQCEALTMVATRVYGNDATVAFAASQGNFQLNVFTPVIADALLESIRLLADGCVSFTRHALEGMRPDRERIRSHLEDSIMLVTALAPHIGYDAAAAIAKDAHARGTSLREAALASGEVSGEDFDRWVVPGDMVHP